MTFDIELDGTRRRVTVRRAVRLRGVRRSGETAGDKWVAAIDGREVEVSVVERAAVGLGGGDWSMLVGPAEAGHYESYEVAFESTADGALIVHVNGVAVRLVVNEPGAPKPWAKAAHRRRHGAVDGEAGDEPRNIVAPMPGRIVKVLVKPDEAVAARQPLVVVEAMKMENELRAPRAGIVADVRVVEGASVEANTVVVVLR